MLCDCGAEVPRLDKPRDRRRAVGWNKRLVFNGYGLSVWEDEKVL